MNRHDPAPTLAVPGRGPVDVIGDVHGCFSELVELLGALGWRRDAKNDTWDHPDGRSIVFTGDLVNRGPDSLEVARLVTSLMETGRVRLVRGNHDHKALLWMQGQRGRPRPHFVKALRRLPNKVRRRTAKRLARLLSASTLWVPWDRALIVVHAAWHPLMSTLDPELVEQMAMYGPRISFPPKPVKLRLDWRLAYPQDAPLCIFGHTAFDGPPTFEGNTLCIDTGCVYGGRLTAYRWPEQDFVSVEARATYSFHGDLQPVPPLLDFGSRVLELAGWPDSSTDTSLTEGSDQSSIELLAE